MNPFRVVVEDADFRSNPLIGILGLSYLKENEVALARENIYFAHTIDGTLLLQHFRLIGYSEAAIKDFFCACRDAGLLRPVPLSPKIYSDPVEHRHIHETYIIDDRALSRYYDLIYCRHVKTPMIFYNSAVRAHYGISLSHQVDNILYEVFTSLIFLMDLMRREEQLESLVCGTGVLIQPVSSRIRSAVIPFLYSVIGEVRDKRTRDRGNEELLAYVDQLLEQVRLRISRSAGII